MATETLPQDSSNASASFALRINLADYSLTGRSVERPSDSRFLTVAAELPLGNYGLRNIPESFQAGVPIKLGLRTDQWMPLFDKDDIIVFDLSLTPTFGDIVLAGNPGKPAYVCRYERGDRDETAYSLRDGLGTRGDRMSHLPVWGVAVEHIQEMPAAIQHPRAVRRLRAGGNSFAYDVSLGAEDFSGSTVIEPTASVWGDLNVAAGLGRVSIDNDLHCSDSITIGEGTTLVVCGQLVVTGTIKGAGSLECELGMTGRDVQLGGDLKSSLSVNLSKSLHVDGSFICGDPVEATAVWIGGNAKVEGLIKCSALFIGGEAELTGVEAGYFECGGDASCAWHLKSEGQVDIHGNLKVAEELRANLAITVAGTIETGGRIFAGLDDAFAGNDGALPNRTVRCKKLLSDTLAYGILVECEPKHLPALAVDDAHLMRVMALANQRYVDTKDDLWRESRDAVSELLRVRRVVADARKGLAEVEALAAGARVEEAAEAQVEAVAA